MGLLVPLDLVGLLVLALLTRRLSALSALWDPAAPLVLWDQERLKRHPLDLEDPLGRLRPVVLSDPVSLLHLAAL